MLTIVQKLIQQEKQLRCLCIKIKKLEENNN